MVDISGVQFNEVTVNLLWFYIILQSKWLSDRSYWDICRIQVEKKAFLI